MLYRKFTMARFIHFSESLVYSFFFFVLSFSKQDFGGEKNEKKQNKQTSKQTKNK